MIGFVTWPPFLHHHYYKGGQVTKPIIVVKICYKLLYVIQVVLISNFLVSADIKVFGRTYLFTMLLLIDLALFIPRVFLFSIVRLQFTLCIAMGKKQDRIF